MFHIKSLPGIIEQTYECGSPRYGFLSYPKCWKTNDLNNNIRDLEDLHHPRDLSDTFKTVPEGKFKPDNGDQDFSTSNMQWVLLYSNQ